jgi:hypothetical protein
MAIPQSDTGYRPIEIVGGDGEHSAVGQIEMATGHEERPCMICRSWEKDEKRLIGHLIHIGLEPRPDGKFVTPIVKDIPGRKSLIIDPKSWGFCRRQTIPTDCLATCEDFVAVRTTGELASRIK